MARFATAATLFLLSAAAAAADLDFDQRDLKGKKTAGGKKSMEMPVAPLMNVLYDCAPQAENYDGGDNMIADRGLVQATVACPVGEIVTGCMCIARSANSGLLIEDQSVVVPINGDPSTCTCTFICQNGPVGTCDGSTAGLNAPTAEAICCKQGTVAALPDM